MSLLPLRRASLTLGRSISTTSSRFAAAAAAPAVAPRTFTRKTAVPATSPTRAGAVKAKPASRPLPPIEDDYPAFDPDDFPAPLAGIEDYSHLAPSSKPASVSAPTSTPTPSAPLTALPDKSYKPLPSPAVTASIPGEAKSSDWSISFQGLSERPFEKEVAAQLLKPLAAEDIELKPDGLLYLPEIKYRRTLNAAFGPGGWGLAPRGETNVGPRIVSREWGLVCLGRLVAIARGEQEYFDPSGIPTATEACKSNALMRCCKDLGIASELWDPRFIREFKSKHCVEAFVEHQVTKKKRKLWRKKGEKFEYPYKE
ncbi:hypothetical protein P7C73_g4434, partial [Tremellales sp. Uapishka_1]